MFVYTLQAAMYEALLLFRDAGYCEDVDEKGAESPSRAKVRRFVHVASNSGFFGTSTDGRLTQCRTDAIV